MIKQRTFYMVFCDRCGEGADLDEMWVADEEQAYEVAGHCEYLRIPTPEKPDGIYCGHCYFVDDDDEYKIIPQPIY